MLPPEKVLKRRRKGFLFSTDSQKKNKDLMFGHLEKIKMVDHAIKCLRYSTIKSNMIH